MGLNVLRFVSVILTALVMSAGFAHLFALPNKIALPREAYFTVQQIYRGWALIGGVLMAAAISTVTLAIQVRHTPGEFRIISAAAACIVLGIVVFFVFTQPANAQTANWTVVPDNWQQLRRQWEYSHAVATGLYFVALMLLTLSLMGARR